MSFKVLITKMVETFKLVKTLREKKQEKSNTLKIDNNKRIANKVRGGGVIIIVNRKRNESN